MEVKLRNVRLAFSGIFTATSVGESDDKRFSAVFIFEPGDDNHQAISKAVKEVAGEKWKGDADKILKSILAKNDICLQDGSVMSEYDGFEGKKFVRASNKARPTVIDRDRTPLTEADGRPYSGCFVNAIIDVWAQDNKYGKRINASLSGVQFKADGDAFSGGRVASADQFDAEAGEGDGFDGDAPSAGGGSGLL